MQCKSSKRVFGGLFFFTFLIYLQNMRRIFFEERCSPFPLNSTRHAVSGAVCSSAQSVRFKLLLHENVKCGSSRFRMRIIGNSVSLLPVQCDGNTLVAIVPPCLGAFFAELAVLFTDFNESSLSSNTFVSLDRTVFSRSFHLEKVHCPRTNGDTSFSMPAGFWRIENITLLHLFHTSRAGSLPESLGWLFGTSHFNFSAQISYNTSSGLRDFSHERELLHSCTQGAKYCFVGDSQLRHLHNHCISFLSPQGIHFERDQILRDSRFKFQWRVYGGVPLDAALLLGCTNIFVNFGQWPAGWPGKLAWELPKYSAAVDYDLQQLQRLAQPGQHILWVATNSYPMTAAVRADPPQDWRNDGVLDIYNAAASTLAQRRGVDVVDTYTPTKILQDFSYDEAHYKGAIGAALANLVFNSVCCGNKKLC